MIFEEQFPVPRYTAAGKIGNSVISLLWQLWCRCNPDHNKFSSSSNTTVVEIFPKLCLWRLSLCSNLGGMGPKKLYRATLKLLVIYSFLIKKLTHLCRLDEWQLSDTILQLSICEWLRDHEETILVFFRSGSRYFSFMYFHMFLVKLWNKLLWLFCLFVCCLLFFFFSDEIAFSSILRIKMIFFGRHSILREKKKSHPLRPH